MELSSFLLISILVMFKNILCVHTIAKVDKRSFKFLQLVWFLLFIMFKMLLRKSMQRIGLSFAWRSYILTMILIVLGLIESVNFYKFWILLTCLYEESMDPMPQGQLHWKIYELYQSIWSTNHISMYQNLMFSFFLNLLWFV